MQKTARLCIDGYNFYYSISPAMLMKSRLPDDFRDKSSGEVIHNIPEWRKKKID